MKCGGMLCPVILNGFPTNYMYIYYIYNIYNMIYSGNGSGKGVPYHYSCLICGCHLIFSSVMF